ncbi:MAG: efflux RND transporter periplasmic adaptor subunit [Deltaproteobacteria bacterium]|nr:efflux RND transporter periplasmic adaptor subunit [Deltaproteobacteria bacterium]
MTLNTRSITPLLLIASCIITIFPGRAFSADPPAPPPARVVTALLIERQVAPTIALTGSVVAELESRVAAEVSGQVISAPPKEGTFVKKGGILCQLDGELLQRSLEVANREIDEAKILLEKGNLDFERVKPVFESQATSKQTYDDRLYRLKELEAKLAITRVRRDQLQIELNRKTIRAPFSGVVAERLCEIGEWLAVGSTVCHLIDLSTLAAEIPVPARYLPFIEPGTVFTVRVGPDAATIAGRFNRIIPAGDFKARTFPLRLDLPAAARLLPGYDVEVLVPTGKPEKALLAPRAAIVRNGEQTTIVTITDNRAEIIPVVISGYDGNDAIIASGRTAAGTPLTPGLAVVIRGNERLRPGQPVTVVPAASRQTEEPKQ